MVYFRPSGSSGHYIDFDTFDIALAFDHVALGVELQINISTALFMVAANAQFNIVVSILKHFEKLEFAKTSKINTIILT
eukprot:COSAG05_NODE_826_length_7102_cov_4.065829_2_plen_79_part_00